MKVIIKKDAIRKDNILKVSPVMMYKLTSQSQELQDWLLTFDDSELRRQGWSASRLRSLADLPQTLMIADPTVKSIIFYQKLGETHYEILFLATLQHHRRQGLLKNLLQEFIQSYSPCLIWLECRLDNAAALELYSRCGFKKDGLRHNYYSDGTAAVCMSYSADSVGTEKLDPLANAAGVKRNPGK